MPRGGEIPPPVRRLKFSFNTDEFNYSVLDYHSPCDDPRRFRQLALDLNAFSGGLFRLSALPGMQGEPYTYTSSAVWFLFARESIQSLAPANCTRRF